MSFVLCFVTRVTLDLCYSNLWKDPLSLIPYLVIIMIIILGNKFGVLAAPGDAWVWFFCLFVRLFFSKGDENILILKFVIYWF